MKITFSEDENERFSKFIKLEKLAIDFKQHPKANLVPGNCCSCSLRLAEYFRPLPNEIYPESHFLFVDRNPLTVDVEAGRRHSLYSSVGKMFESYLRELCIERNEISISTVVHCNLPDGKPPKPEQIRKCSGWKKYELGMMQNLKFIFLLGDFPVRQFFPTIVNLSYFLSI